MQINLENNTKNAFIFIIYPPALNNKGIRRLRKLLCNEKIIKIIHGGESLDIPYIFDDLLKNKNKIKRFLTNLYDTKFLCEFHHYQNNITNKCNIYNLLEEFKIIDKKNIKHLTELENKIGEIYLVEFKINSLSNELIEYALYDVIYLPELIKKFINISEIYKETIREMTSIIYYNKKINKKFIEFNKNINSFNNNFILHDNIKINLIDIFYYYFYYELYDNISIQLSNVTYFKNFIKTIIKYKIYLNVLKNNIVYISNNLVTTNTLEYDINNILLNKKIFNNI
jgi:hypothetical protein